MKTSVFLSYPRPFNREQEAFIDALKTYMHMRGFEPRTLGVTDYDSDVPLRAIRRLMLESYGIVTVAFRRTKIIKGSSRPGHQHEYSLDEKWLTSPYCQIEPAMAYQIGLPTIILRENCVVPEGLLEKGVTDFYMPVFNLDEPADIYFGSDEWQQLFRRWESRVSRVQENRGMPPKLY